MDLTAKDLAEEKVTAFDFLSSARPGNRVDVNKYPEAGDSK